MNEWNNLEGYQECPNTTKLLEIISFDIFSKSLEEIKNNLNLFGNHSNNPVYISSGPLRECRSVFINEGPFRSRDLLTNNKFVETNKLLEFLKNKISPNANITRTYITILPPGKIIYPHSDASGNYFPTINRYQFYFTGNKECIQIIKNENFKIEPGYFYHFDHRQIHEYKNNSNEDLILIVFDIKKTRI